MRDRPTTVTCSQLFDSLKCVSVATFNISAACTMCVCTVAAHVHNEYSRKSAITGIYVLAEKNNSNNRKCYKRRFSLRPEKVGSCFLHLKVSYIANIAAAKLT